MKATTFLKKALVDWERAVDRLSTQERGNLRRDLEGLAVRAAEAAAYVDERHGYGCGDQGHEAGVKNSNKVGKKVWMGAFGYNKYLGVRF